MEISDKEKQEIILELRNAWHGYSRTQEETIKSLSSFSEHLDKLPEFTEQIDNEFEKSTGLRAKDIIFVVFASALQVIRQVFLNHFKERMSDQEAAKMSFGHNNDEHSNRGKRYYASVEEILSNPVPFDCISKEEVVVKYDNPKISGFNHRYIAVGHDPYIGLIVGTANILTNTLTLTQGNFVYKTYHVHTGIAYRKETPYEIDKLCARARTSLMFEKIYSRIKSEGNRGFKALAVALVKEIVHLLSDFRTKQSLPLPIVNSINPDLSRIAGVFGIDYLAVKSFERESYLSIIINFIIQLLHQMCYNEKEDGSVESYKVRTIKVIQYSNEIALGSNLIQTLVRLALGDPNAFRDFDLGGSFVAMHHTLHDPITIKKIELDYLLSKQVGYIKNF